MNKSLIVFYSLLIIILMPACQVDPGAPVLPEPERGEIIDYALLNSFTKNDVEQLISDRIPPPYDQLLAPAYGVEVYRVHYHSIDPFGNDILASGAVAIPVGMTSAAPLSSYQHGTMSKKTQAPSYGLDNNGEVFVGITLASEGFVMNMPDYLGLGDSPGPHYYVHAASEASATIDLLRAARILCTEKEVTLNDQLFLTGYSQGGHATMATHMVIERDYPEEFTVTASAPMAGPYDMSGAMVNLMLSEEPYPTPMYLPFTLLSYDKVYKLYNEPLDYLKSHYAAILPTLFDGTFSSGQINDVMPEAPIHIVNSETLQAFKDQPQSHPLRVALKKNDLHQWNPIAPIRMFHCQADDQVPYQNSVVALAEFQANGNTGISLTTPDNLPGINLDHQDCALPSLLGARQWFIELKE